MSAVSHLDGPGGRRLAYALTEGRGPCTVFLPGYRSDMEGTKAVHLEGWAKSRGSAFLRLDYSGHGRSGGRFEEGCIGDWTADAQAVIEAATDGPVVLVGSSMGGWVGCLLTQRLSRVAGFVGIAAAPDFTEDGFWAGFSEDERRQVTEAGQLSLPSEYGDPYIVTRRLIEDGRRHLVLRGALPMPFPVRLMQGSADAAVAADVPLRLFDRIEGDDVRLTLVKGADHRFSDSACLALLERAVAEAGG